jgi:uncharacterized RDD family membrane protein YckC
MKSRFEPDCDPATRLPLAARLIDPEAYDASEQRFAASVDEKPVPPRFVADAVPELMSTSMAGDQSCQVDGGWGGLDQGPDSLSASAAVAEGTVALEGELGAVAQPGSLQTELIERQKSDSWRAEVADRVNNYRARRRPRAPRYPSLQLKFDPPEPSSTAHAATTMPALPPTSSRLAVAMQDAVAVPQDEQPAWTGTDETRRLNLAEPGARILEFPRSLAVLAPVFDELAEPVMERPRILEVTEGELPPPALGGILMDPVEEPAQERRPGFELPLHAAPMSRRLLAGSIDSLLVISAFAAFAYIFLRVTSIVPALQQTAAISAFLVALLWAAYQYLLLVYTGSTPGLKLAHLRLSRFDGAAVPKKIRRWRVLASVLSGLSLGLGYAWCFLDEDRLSWHDRITRTYMAPRPPRPEPRSAA